MSEFNCCYFIRKNIAYSQTKHVYLVGLGLQRYIKVFRRHEGDLDSLMLLTERHLIEMNIEVGPRMKIVNAIEEWKADMAKDRAIEDTMI